MRRAILISTVLAILVSAPAGALAGKQDKYTDLAALQPPPNANIDWDCWVNGRHIVCDGTFHDAWSALEIDDLCVFSFYTSGSATSKIRRVHDLEGRTLWTRNVRDIRETLSLKPDDSGPTLRAFGHFMNEFMYGVPGDISTRTESFKGTDVTIVGPRVGLILHDNGLKTFDMDDNVVSAHGPHPILDDPDAAFYRICTAFAELSG